MAVAQHRFPWRNHNGALIAPAGQTRAVVREPLTSRTRESTQSLTLFYGPISREQLGVGTDPNADVLTDYFFRQYFMQMSYSLLQDSRV
jgi:hypothetical protein